MPSWSKGSFSNPQDTKIVREHLLKLLDQCVKSPLTLLLAPAGSGKSTLLADWLKRREPDSFAFLSLTSADASPVHFFRHWLEGLRRAVPAFDTFCYNQLVADVALPADVVADSLLHSFAQVKVPLLIILDDFQHTSDTLTETVFSILVDRLPAHIHLLISSRIQPKFALSQLQLGEKLRVIDREELDLSADELASLAERKLGRRLVDEEVNHLLEMTEGWLAGIRFALLTHHHDHHPELNNFNASHPALIDYFAQVVLGDLPSSDRQMMLCGAITEQFCPALCDALTGRSDAGRVIEGLLSRDLFIQPLAERPGWYRFHGLFQEFLRNRLQIELPDRVACLHRLAAGWLIGVDDHEPALEHARRSGDNALFISMLGACCERWSKSGDFPKILKWVGDFPEEQVVRNSDLGFPLMASLILSRKFNQARYYMDLLHELPRDQLTGRFADDTHGPFLETMLEVFQQDTNFRLSADRAKLEESVSHNDMRAFSTAMLAYHHLLRAEFPAALEHAQRAKDVLGQLGYDYLESYADLILVQCDRHSGRLLESVQASTNMFYRYDQGRRHSPAWVNAATAMVVVRYEQNMLDEAQQLCEELIPLVSSSCATEVIASSYLTLVRVLHIRGEEVKANRLMMHLDRVLQLGLYDRFVAQLAHERMRQAFAVGMPAMNRVAEQYQLGRRLATGLWQRPLAYDEGWERYGLTTALWLRAKNDYGEASQLLSKLSKVLRRDRVISRLVVVETNQAVLLALQGQRQQAKEWLQCIVTEHGVEYVNRQAFDEAPGLAELMAEAISEGVVRVPGTYQKMFSDVLGPLRLDATGSDARSSATPVADALLTQREAEIFQWLRQGLSNQAISEKTGVALSTSKWHLKNIFAKLGISSRAEAIVYAEKSDSSFRASRQ